MPTVTPRFREWAPVLVRRLISDFKLTDYQAAGAVGNFGQESGGFVQMQELRPTVPGSRGGLGMGQWTGPRRLEFEEWLARNKDKGWTAHSLDANYSFLYRELVGPEKATVSAVKACKTLREATETFCRKFERPGIFHMADRLWWAEQALALYRSSAPAPVPAPVPTSGLKEGLSMLQGLLIAILPKLIEQVLEQKSADPNVNVNSTPAGAREVAAEVVKEVAALPEVQHVTNTEPWHRSRVTWGAIITAVASIIGIAVTAEQREEWTTIAITAAPLIGAFVTIVGRWMAKRPLGT